MSLAFLVSNFILHCQVKGLSAKTMRSYDLAIRKFTAYFSCDDAEMIDKQVINGYTNYLLSLGLSRHSVNNYLRSLKVFFKYLDDEYAFSLAKYIHFTKAPKKEKKIYNNGEIKVMLDYLSTTEQPIRDKIIFLLMYDSGLRLSEVVTLRTDSIDFENNTILITGKGNKQRYVSIGKTLTSLMRMYNGGKVYFLCTKQGKPITQEAVVDMFRRMKAVTGINIHPHLLRHNYATNFMIHQINSGSVDIYQLQMLMGHADSATTKIYLHMAQKMIAVRNAYSHIDEF